MYSSINFKTKKALKEAVAAGKTVTIFQPNDMFGNPKAAPNYTGSASLEGPHFPAAHTWYSTVQVKDGKVVSVK